MEKNPNFHFKSEYNQMKQIYQNPLQIVMIFFHAAPLE